ncbi:hypothetical protein C9374_008545 [Naegleria lovaniensis]|uniref:PH domain-containing protein n=1 Tax=Naegleria lovaniensis TaxID=51637 RepID=A0AA88KFK7_NAELO|nr:uncharacterized protein C9374_008545 [Naegleria lovaniensis]KAG2378402.1 hypothetical protein C9374_008545 [Naegleria lovaniensis]
MVRFTNFKSSPQPKESHKYEMSGVLCKMGEVNKSWKERFFILEDDKLFYYKNNEATKAIAYIPLNDAYVRVSPEFYPKLACFEIVTAQRIYKLQAANFELMKTWIHHCQTFSKISMENELIRQADIQICATEAAYSKKLLEELHFEPMPLDNFYFVCKYEDDDNDLLEGVTTTPLEVENSKESNITNATRTRHRSAAMNLSFSSQLSHLINSESSSSLNASSSVIISNDEQEFVEDMLPSTPQNKANVSINSTSPSSDYSVPPTSSLMQSSSLLLSSSLIEGKIKN